MNGLETEMPQIDVFTKDIDIFFHFHLFFLLVKTHNFWGCISKYLYHAAFLKIPAVALYFFLFSKCIYLSFVMSGPVCVMIT